MDGGRIQRRALAPSARTRSEGRLVAYAPCTPGSDNAVRKEYANTCRCEERSWENGSALVDPLGESTKAARRHDRRYRLGSLSDLAHNVSGLLVIDLCIDLSDRGTRVAEDYPRRFDAVLFP